MAFNKNDYRKQLKEEDKKYKALQKVKKENEKKRLKKQRNIFLKLKEKQEENEAEQEELEEKKEERKQRRKNLLDKGIASAKNASKKFKKNVKKAKKGKVAKIVARFLIPGGLASFALLLVFFVMFTIYAGGIVGTIAGLANPQQRALLEAKGLLGNKEVTTIPSYLIGDEPDLKGSGGSLFGNNNTSGTGDLGDLTIKDSDPIDLIAYKAALQVQQKDQIQGKFALAQMFFESGVQLNSPLVKNGKNLAGLSWPGRKPIPPGTTKGSEHAEGDGSYLYFDHYQHFADEYVTWLHQDIPDGASVKSPTQFATILKSKHYFTAPLSQYVNGVCALADKKWAEMQQKYGNLKGNSNGGNNNNSNNNGGDSINSLPASAKWIMQRESSGNIHATNGRYYGLFQLDKSYYPKLCGKSYDQTNAADQIKAATAYMKQRYGSWDKAQAFWQANGWW